MYCKKCGKENNDSSSFCVGCGEPLGNYSEEYTVYEQTPVTYQSNEDRVVSIGNWMWTMVVMCIPVASLIMCFIWAFNSSVVPSKRNYFKAMLIWKLIAVGIVLTVVSIILIISAIAASQAKSYYSYYSYY